MGNGNSSPMVTILGLAHHTCTSRVGCIVLPCGGAGPALLSVAAGGRSGTVLSLMTTGPALPPDPGIDGVCVWG